MRLLLDTHIAVWAALQPDALSKAESVWIEAAEQPLMLSVISVWELRLKWQSFHISGARKGPIDPRDIVTFGTAAGWRFLPLAIHHATALLFQPIGHKDPFDELLLVQAQEEGLRLLTRDAKLTTHPLALADAGT